MPPRNLTLAVLSDIHGNTWALSAVLANIDKRGIRRIVNLGDTVYGPLDPRGTAELLMGLDLVSIRGNEDRILEEESLTPSPTLAYVRSELTLEQARWLKQHPFSRCLDDSILMVHGTPRSDKEYLIEEISPAGIKISSVERLQEVLAGINAGLILCGHSHVPRTVPLPGGRVVVNPGSVGLPAYTDDSPVPHKMETGSPHARYAIIHQSPAGWDVEQIAVAYDWEQAVSTAKKHGREDWARWLATGRAEE